MRSDQILKSALLIGGIATMAIGIAHIFMPSLGYDSDVASSMSAEIRNHFYFLATYAICSFLLTLGFLSIYFSKLTYPDASFVVCAVLSVLWIARLMLELKYPVEVRLFVVDRPSTVLLPVIAAIAILYSVATVGYAVRQKQSI